MSRAWREHGAAVGILVLVGGLSIVGVKEQVPGTLGTRAFGYGALVLLAAALSIGPVARLWPRRLAALLPYRRAIGIWSALAGVVHFLFVLQLVGFELYHRNLVTLFFHEIYRPYETGPRRTTYIPALFDHLSLVAWAGLAALVILAGIALVSNDRAQRFLGNSSWKLIQQQAYSAIMFVAVHILLMKYGGKLKLSPPLQWWAPWLPLCVALLQAAGFIFTVWRQRTRRAEAVPPARAD